MVKILDSKVEEKKVYVGSAKVSCTVYSTRLEVSPRQYQGAEDVLRDVDKLCYLGENRKKGIYNSMEEMRNCGNCATQIRSMHAEAIKKGQPFIVKVSSNKPALVLPNLTVARFKNIKDASLPEEFTEDFE